MGIPRSVKLIEEAAEGNRLIGMVAMTDPSVEEPGIGQTYGVGTVGIIHKVVSTDDGSLQVIVQGLERFRIKEWITEQPYLKAKIELIPDIIPQPIDVEKDNDSGRLLEMEALKRNLLDSLRRLVSLTPQLPEQIVDFINKLDDPRYMVYLTAANIRMTMEQAQEILGQDDFVEKMRSLITILSKESGDSRTGTVVQEEAQSEMEKRSASTSCENSSRPSRKCWGEGDESRSK